MWGVLCGRTCTFLETEMALGNKIWDTWLWSRGVGGRWYAIDVKKWRSWSSNNLFMIFYRSVISGSHSVCMCELALKTVNFLILSGRDIVELKCRLRILVAWRKRGRGRARERATETERDTNRGAERGGGGEFLTTSRARKKSRFVCT